jgi:hypothetical protein
MMTVRISPGRRCGAALAAEAARAAAAGGEGEEGRGPLREDAGAALVADATCASAAGGDDEGEAGLGLPPCQAVAEDPEGSFTSGTAEGGRRDKASATRFAFSRDVSNIGSEFSQKSKLPLDSGSLWI